VLQAGQPPPPKPPEAIRQDFKVLYEDEHILAVDKPSGLAIHPGPASPEKRSSTRSGHTWRGQGVQTPEASSSPARHTASIARPAAVVVVAKTRQAMVRLTEMFTAGEADKTYLALAEGPVPARERQHRPAPGEHKPDHALKQPAGVNLQRRSPTGRRLAGGRKRRCSSDPSRTGRTAPDPAPLAGDRPFGGGGHEVRRLPFNRIAQRQWGVRRMFCTAPRLELAHPLTKKRLIFESPLPQELADCLPRAGIRWKTQAS